MRHSMVYPNIFMIEKKMTIVIGKIICRYKKKSTKVNKKRLCTVFIKFPSSII